MTNVYYISKEEKKRRRDIRQLNWSGSSGNYYKQITAATHGKGTYPSVHTYVQNGSLWEETYDSPAIDDSGNVTVYTNVAISIKVVIK